MGIMDMFRSGATQQQQTPPATGGGQGQGVVPNAGNSTPPAVTPGTPPAFAAGQANKEGTTDAPLANFAELWKLDGTNKPAGLDAPTFNIDPAKIREAAGKLDFAQGMPAELITKALTGDQQAFAGVINHAVQAAYAQSALASTKIVESALKAQAEQFKAALPEEVRKQQLNSTLRQDNPLFDNPAVSPMLGMIQEQMALKYPSATPQQLAEQARNYLTQFASAIQASSSPQSQQTGNSTKLQGSKEDDWSKFFSS